MTRLDEIIERMALAILNSDRTMRGLRTLESRDNVPDSGGYVVNARAALAAALEPLGEIAREIVIQIKRLPHGDGLPFPAYATAQAAGMDIASAENLILAPGLRHAVATGFAIAIPAGYEVQIRPRSGLALKHGVTCLNTPGTIDADYRGEVKVILANLGSEPFEIKRGDRIAQIVPAIVTQAVFAAVDELDATERGAGGFGSTGT